MVFIFRYFLYYSEYNSLLLLSSKTEVGSAGEQPAKDALIADESVNSMSRLLIAH